MKIDKKRVCIIGGAVLLLVLIIVLAASCQSPAAKQLSSEEAIRLYNQAADFTDENFSLRISQNKTIIIQGNTFNQQTEQVITYEAYGTSDMRSTSEQTLSMGDHTVAISQTYADGIVYMDVADSLFFGPLNGEAYLTQQAPAVLLNPDLYETVAGVKTGKTADIIFSQATDPETWVNAAITELVCAEGSADISDSGQLEKSFYQVAYWIEDVYIRLSTEVEIVYEPQSTVTLPEDPSLYTHITYVNAPQILEVACGYLLSADAITSAYTNSIFCQAFGDRRDQTVSIHTVSQPQWSAQLDTAITLSNSSKSGTTSTLSQTECFAGNTYTIATNGAKPVPNNEISEDAMRKYCRDLLIGTIMLPQYITDVSISETETVYQITFSASEDFAGLLRNEACTTLYQNPDILAQQMQSYETDIMMCYLTIDKHTGFPLASGFHYGGTYTIDALPYLLEFQADQTYTLPDPPIETDTNNEAGA